MVRETIASGNILFWTKPARTTAELFANATSTTFALDLFLAVLVALMWMTVEARRLGLRRVWRRTGCRRSCSGFRATLPLFLFVRERHLRDRPRAAVLIRAMVGPPRRSSCADGRVELVDTARIERSPLYNEDLAPVPIARRTWTTYNYAALWISMAHCIPTYMLAAGLMAAGMSWAQALFTVRARQHHRPRPDPAQLAPGHEVRHSLPGVRARRVRDASARTSRR